MLFSKAALAAAVVTFMVFVDAKDVMCKKGKMKAQVTLDVGDSFSFRSTRVYAGRQRCRVNYKLGSCTAASVSCSKFDLKADKICRTGDSITLNTKGSQPRKFCQTKGPKDVSFKKPFSIFFKSNKWKGGAFKCEVSCTAGPPPVTSPPTRMIVMSYDVNQIYSVNLTSGDVCVLPMYPGANFQFERSVAAAYIESIGKVVVLKECDDPGQCETYSFDGTVWELLEPINQPTGNYSYVYNVLMAASGYGDWWVSTIDPNSDIGYVSEIFDGSTWKEGPQFDSVFPKYACVVQIDESSTMVVGGQYQKNNVSVYDRKTNSWMESAPLNEGRYVSGCALVEGQGVLVVGGYGSYGLNSVEIFDFQSKIWIEQPDFPFTTFYTKCLSLGTSVICLPYYSRMVYKRGEDGTWAPIEGINLPGVFYGTGIDRAFMIPDTFPLQCEQSQKSGPVNLLTEIEVEEREQVYKEKLKSMMPSQMADFLPV